MGRFVIFSPFRKIIFRLTFQDTLFTASFFNLALVLSLVTLNGEFIFGRVTTSNKSMFELIEGLL